MRPAWKERKGQTTQGDRRVSGTSMVPWVEMCVQESCGNSAVCPDSFSKACLSHSCGAGTLVRGRGERKSGCVTAGEVEKGQCLQGVSRVTAAETHAGSQSRSGRNLNSTFRKLEGRLEVTSGF